MSVSKNYLNTARYVPETDETDWGAEVTTELGDLLDGADELLCRDSSLNFFLRLQAADSSLAASATLTPTSPVHRVQGTSAAVTLDTTTAIADGAYDGQILILIGANDTNTVTIEHNSNCQLNGDITLTKYDILALHWDDTNSNWIEMYRSN